VNTVRAQTEDDDESDDDCDFENCACEEQCHDFHFDRRFLRRLLGCGRLSSLRLRV
jgi:hypothetical protein